MDVVDLSEKECALLKALYAARGLQIMTAADLLSAYPETFGGRTAAGIRQTVASLVRKGLAGRDQTFSPLGRLVTGYYIREAGCRVLLDAAREGRSGG